MVVEMPGMKCIRDARQSLRAFRMAIGNLVPVKYGVMKER